MISTCSDEASPNFHRLHSLKVLRTVSESRVHRAMARQVEIMNIEVEQACVQTNLEEYGQGAESDCAKAMAAAEKVLRELSLVPLFTRRSSPGRSSSANEKAEDAISDFRPVIAMPDCVPLDAGLDFVVHDDGMIGLTEAGFRRMGQAHSAGRDTVIEVDGRDVLHFPASKPG
jgi:hypothetical protein